MGFGKWIYFQYILSFVLQKPLPMALCFQDVPSFVFFVVLASPADFESSCNSGFTLSASLSRSHARLAPRASWSRRLAHQAPGDAIAPALPGAESTRHPHH
jgi:hypothetical protein